jgi:polyferredoxin
VCGVLCYLQLFIAIRGRIYCDLGNAASVWRTLSPLFRHTLPTVSYHILTLPLEIVVGFVPHFPTLPHFPPPFLETLFIRD